MKITQNLYNLDRYPVIDTSFDFRSDVKPYQDPDIHSKQLRQNHKLLWSKELPNGDKLNLKITTGKYLVHESDTGFFEFSSDGILHSYITTKRMNHITSQLDDKYKKDILKEFYTIGGFIIFPSNKIDNKLTINGSRGFNSRIVDRFDLTLECIRKYYLNIESPLFETFQRYSEFFNLFKDFKGYVEFFLLQDLVNENFSEVNFFLPFDESFPTQPLPKNVDEYTYYIKNNKKFLERRNSRIENWVKNNNT